ncbi:MAG: D-alanine--D-alanine ligase [Gammaproteobacteria bacterium]|nr:D-alanine--D-alanine ligase [Gammaproteobacteria bacterium]
MNVAVVAGGVSREHSVSLLSAQTVTSALLSAGHRVWLLVIEQDGNWRLADQTRFLAQSKDVKTISAQPEAVEVIVQPVPGKFLTIDGELIPIDCVFPITHGTLGEDGSIQGLFKLAAVPFVGPDVQGSANAFDKVQTRRLIEGTPVPQVFYSAVPRHDYRADPAAVVEGIAKSHTFPLFVKASCQGSSVGVVRVASADGLGDALNEAFRHGVLAIVETAVEQAMEVEVAVLGNESPQASLVGQIITSQQFYDFDDKYVLGESRTEIPAKLSDETTQQVRDYAVEVYKALGLEGMSRVDFLIGADGVPRLIEANTLPGFTAISMYPKLWEASGVALTDLVDRLIQLAVDRAQRDQL